MNKEQYLKKVMKNLNCSHRQKREIRKDIENDIDIACEQGESLDNLFKRLGSPVDYAMELNESFDFEKRKPYHKIAWIVIGVIVCLAIGGGTWIYLHLPKTKTIEESQIFHQEDIVEKTNEIIDLVSENDYQGIVQLSNKEMLEALNESLFDEAIDNLGELGQFEKITSQQCYEVKSGIQTLVVSEIVALYQKRSVTYTISLDENMQLAGLYMK